MSLAATLSRPAYRFRWKAIAPWALGVGLALYFLLDGASKLYGTAATVQTFALIGIGQWLRYFTGMMEIFMGFALLYPATTGLGALVGAAAMILATSANLYIGHDPIYSAVLAGLFLVIAWTKRDQLVAIVDGV